MTNKKLVLVGRKYPKYTTQHITLDTKHEWPEDDLGPVDEDFILKQEAEQASADGKDL